MALRHLSAGETDEATALASVRRLSFWSREQPDIQLRWAVVQTAAEQLSGLRDVEQTLRTRAWALDELIDAYTRHATPWMRVDRLERELETRFARCSYSEGLDDSLLLEAVTICRTRYVEILDRLARAFSGALSTAGFRATNALPHTGVFRTVLAPLLASGARTVYLLVDALRYEMAAALPDGLDDDFDVKLEPVLGQLPGITSVGMAALLPGAEKGLEVGEEGGRLTPKRKKELESAQLVVVTSQELDRHGEGGGEDENVRLYMDDTLQRLRRAIRALAGAGFQEFCVVADHGFFLGQNLDPGLLMDSPGGQVAELKPRVWVGRGGTAAPGYIRVEASHLGLGGDLQVALPEGLGAFRVKGGAGSYFHGGATPQETILPLCRLSRKSTPHRPASDITLRMALSRPTITSRFFSVTLTLTAEGLFADARSRVRMEVLSGKEHVGAAVMAAYGFGEGTREITVAAGRPNSVTVQLLSVPASKRVSLRAVDSDTEATLARLADVPIDLMV